MSGKIMGGHSADYSARADKHQKTDKPGSRRNDAREMALSALERRRRDGAWLSETITGGDAREVSLASAIAFGVAQNETLLDFYIGSFLRTKPKKLEPKVLDILRISAYQILFMDGIPARAAVSEGVALTGKLGYARASGLVNAVLRRLAELSELPEIPGRGSYPYLATAYSHPEWIVREYLDRLGYDETEKLLRANNEKPPLTLRVNTLRADTGKLIDTFLGLGLSAKEHPWLSDSIVIADAGNPTKLPGFDEGHFFVQDAAAALAVYALGLKRDDTVLDCCCAPGGKSFAAGIAMNGRGRVISADAGEKKLVRVSGGAERLGLGCVETRVMDAREPDGELIGLADAVIADVPCSGLGVIAKKPEIRYRAYDTVSGLPKLQGEILLGASRCVKPGGALVYSTCTTRSAENEEVVTRFLEENRDFRAEMFSLPQKCGEEPGMMITLWPHIHGTDGFFIARLVRVI